MVKLLMTSSDDKQMLITSTQLSYEIIIFCLAYKGENLMEIKY